MPSRPRRCADDPAAAASASTTQSDSCLLVGTDAGFLQLHAADTGAMLHRQQLHNKPVVSISIRHASLLHLVDISYTATTVSRPPLRCLCL